MRRRALLSALAGASVGLAGCSVRWGPGERPRGDATRTTGRTTDAGAESTVARDSSDGPEVARGIVRSRGGGFGSATVVELETGPRTYALRPDRYRPVTRVTVRMAFDRPATAAHPARLAVRVDNAATDEVRIASERLPVLGRSVARPPPGYDDRQSLVFAPAATNDFADAVPAVRRGPDGYWRLAEDADPTSWGHDPVRLDPGAKRQCDVVVVGHPGGTGRPPGEYVAGNGPASVSLSVWDTERPGPTEESRFEDRGTLHIHEVNANVSWYHTANERTAVYLEPSTERAGLPASPEFTAVNHSTVTLACGHWTLYKLVDGEFYHLWPDERTATCRTLAPGATKTFRLRAFPGEPPRGSGVGRGVVRGYLGGGTYAVVAGYDDAKAMSGALVELVGDSVAVVPTNDVYAHRVGDTIVARSRKHATADREAAATVTLTRADGATLSKIPEQIMRPRHRVLRNTVPFFGEDVERVVLYTDEAVARRTLGEGANSKRFAFDGRAYRIVLSREV